MCGPLSLCVPVAFPAAMIRDPDRSNLREKVIYPGSLVKGRSTVVGESGQEKLEAMLTAAAMTGQRGITVCRHSVAHLLKCSPLYQAQDPCPGSHAAHS